LTIKAVLVLLKH